MANKLKNNPFENLRKFLRREIARVESNIMSAISDFAAKVNASFDTIKAAVTDQGTEITGIADDVAFLKEKIEELQNNPGPITPEDQALLDAIDARTNEMAASVDTVKQTLAALNAATARPPAPPPA